MYPKVTFGEGRQKTVRYFPDKLPIAITKEDRRHVFIYLVTRRDSLYLMESTNFIALVRRIRDAVAKVKNSQNFPKIW